TGSEARGGSGTIAHGRAASDHAAHARGRTASDAPGGSGTNAGDRACPSRSASAYNCAGSHC
ncbi:MAG TPA: hypothetical protein VIP78_13440, partial [Candidatus Dormibacteraeota bacterium]